MAFRERLRVRKPLFCQNNVFKLVPTYCGITLRELKNISVIYMSWVNAVNDFSPTFYNVQDYTSLNIGRKSLILHKPFHGHLRNIMHTEKWSRIILPISLKFWTAQPHDAKFCWDVGVTHLYKRPLQTIHCFRVCGTVFWNVRHQVKTC